MSGPPEYQPLSADDELAHVNRSHKRSPSSDSLHVVPSYPPGASAAQHEGEGSKPFTTWTYEPVWPQKGWKQHAMGRIATSHEDAVSIARRAFPQLEDIPEHKFEFQVQLETSGPALKILDEAWGNLPSMAKSMLVVLTEDERESSRRFRRDLGMFLKGSAAMFLVIGSFVTFLIWVGDGDPKSKKTAT